MALLVRDDKTKSVSSLREGLLALLLLAFQSIYDGFVPIPTPSNGRTQVVPGSFMTRSPKSLIDKGSSAHELSESQELSGTRFRTVSGSTMRVGKYGGVPRRWGLSPPYSHVALKECEYTSVSGVGSDAGPKLGSLEEL